MVALLFQPSPDGAFVNPLFQATRVVLILNVALLLVLFSIWGRNYRAHGAKHTLGLAIFAAVLLAENLLALYLLSFHKGFRAWVFWATDISRIGMLTLNALELVALAFLLRITWE